MEGFFKLTNLTICERENTGKSQKWAKKAEKKAREGLITLRPNIFIW